MTKSIGTSVLVLTLDPLGKNSLMQLPILSLPRAVPVQRERKPKENIPQTRAERESVRARLRKYVVEAKLVAPLSIADLRKHSEVCVELQGLDPIYTDYVGVLLNSEVWRDQLAKVRSVHRPPKGSLGSAVGSSRTLLNNYP
ncbi:MAG: hypothetical protein ACKOOI_01010 [Pirellula sp.]